MRIIKVENDETAKLLSEKKDSGDDIIVFFYAEWCGHCKSMKDDWKKFTKTAPKELNIGEIESNNIKSLNFDPKVRGYPTIKYYRDNKEVEEFNDERTADKLMKFVTKHLSESKNNKPQQNNDKLNLVADSNATSNATSNANSINTHDTPNLDNLLQNIDKNNNTRANNNNTRANNINTRANNNHWVFGFF